MNTEQYLPRECRAKHLTLKTKKVRQNKYQGRLHRPNFFFRRRENMVYCEECDKKLGILEGYYHPALGKRFLVCGKCYDKIEENMVRWRKFCLSDSYNVESSKVDIQEDWNEKLSNDPFLQKWFKSLWVKLG